MADYDWEALAPYWHIFEQAGSYDADLAAIVEHGAVAPALFVGGGLGTFPSAFARDLRGIVTCVERSPAMARRARELHPELITIISDVCELPFRRGAFPTVVCATGVLEPLDGSLLPALRELARVGREGQVFAVVFMRSHFQLNLHEHVEAWRMRQAFDEQLDRLATEIGDRDQAAQLYARAMPAFPSTLDERDFIDAALAAGLSVRRLREDERHGTALWCLK